MKYFGYFGIESTEHFFDYVTWSVKTYRPDLLSEFGTSSDGYSKKCEGQISEWNNCASALEVGVRIKLRLSHGYAA